MAKHTDSHDDRGRTPAERGQKAADRTKAAQKGKQVAKDARAKGTD